MTSRRVVDALEMAVQQRGAPVGLIAHSDRGSPYASDHYHAELRRQEMVCSRSGVGQCWDNAVVESTFGRLKRERVHHETYATREEARASGFEYIEVFYNRVRRHSTLGYVSPAESERTHNPKLRQPPVHFPWGRSVHFPWGRSRLNTAQMRSGEPSSGPSRSWPSCTIWP